MFSRPDIYIPLIFLHLAVLYAALGLYAWRKNPAASAMPFAWTMFSMSFWTLTYGLEFFLPSLSSRILVTQIRYIGIVSIPVFLWLFALEFTGRGHLLHLRARRLFWVIPFLTLIVIWTNPFHHLFWVTGTIAEVQGLRLLNFQRGVFFWIHVTYAYGLLAAACILLVMELIHRPGIYRAQVSFVILGILMPFIASGIYVSGNSPIPYLDITPLFFLPTAIGLFWAITRYRMLEVLPPEHITVLKNMKDGVVVLNAQQNIVYINPVAEALFNITEQTAIGKPFPQISGMLAARLIPHLTGEEHQAEITIGHADQVQVFEANVTPISRDPRQPERSDSIIILHDITNRKKVEKLLSRRESIMSAIGMAAEHFLRESTWEHNVPGVLEKIGQAADVCRVYVVMNYTGEDNIIYSSLCYEWASSKVTAQINNPALKHVPLRETGFARWEELFSQGRSIHALVRDLPQREQKFLRALGCVSIVVMPIFVDRQWWGFILFDECREERTWTGAELDAFRTAADIFSAAETRARTEQGLMRRQKSLKLMHEIVSDALRADNLREMAQNAADRLADLIRADGCFLTSWDEETKTTASLAASGKYRDIYPTIQPKPGGKTLTESVLMLGHTLIIEDAYNSPYIDREIAERFSSRSEIVLPLIAGKTKLGALIISFDTIRQFQPEEVALCEQAASLIALAYEKFKTMDDARRRADTSETLRKASLAVAEKLEMDHAASRILEQLHQVVPYDSASVQLLEGDELVIVGGSGFPNPKSVLGIRFPITEEPNSIVMKTGKPYYIRETDNQYPGFNDISILHIRSWLGVPLIYQDRIIGLLTIDGTEPNHFKDEDVRVASEFANQVAVALENARLFQETQTQAITDSLTGTYNRRGLYQLGEFEFQRARRIHRPFSAMIFDIDHFKRVNDLHGHAIGDQVLQRLVERCRQNSRAIDLLGRYGGEEFVILLPETNLEAAKLIAERQRRSIMDVPFITDAGSLRITVSIGVAEASLENTLITLINKADEALYRAKDAGRNRVMAYGTDQAQDQT